MSDIQFPTWYPNNQPGTQEYATLWPTEKECTLIAQVFEENKTQSLQSKLHHYISRIIVTKYGERSFLQLHDIIEETIKEYRVLTMPNIIRSKKYSQELVNILRGDYREYLEILVTLTQEFRARTDVYRSHRLKQIHNQIINWRLVVEDNQLIVQYITNARTYEIQWIDWDIIDGIEMYVQDRQYGQY